MRKLLAGTLVFIKDENLPSTKWSIGRITEIFPGADEGTLLRPACAEGASSPLCLPFVSMLVIQPRSGRTYRPQ
ncbi:hypothetical protein TNCV_5032701 [Trichonephila clavipes]|nr:hypothetical protein TNCV_5032701 [Trichonephila clavipes]